MSLLALDASGQTAGLAVMDGAGAVQQRWSAPLKPGLIETLPLLLREALAGWRVEDIAVCVGPGSFTGLRTSIALAQGVAAGLGARLWPVAAASAFGLALAPPGRALWVAIRARHNRVFLLHDGKAEAYADTDVPLPAGKVVLAGDAGAAIAATLAARGADVMLSEVRTLDVAWVGRAALAAKAAGAAHGPALPLYVDPPEAKLPAGGLRPAPQ